MHFASDVTFTRAFIYALVSGKNGLGATSVEFLAGCNRFGVDNPCPILTKRLALYGN